MPWSIVLSSVGSWERVSQVETRANSRSEAGLSLACLRNHKEKWERERVVWGKKITATGRPVRSLPLQTYECVRKSWKNFEQSSEIWHRVVWPLQTLCWEQTEAGRPARRLLQKSTLGKKVAWAWVVAAKVWRSGLILNYLESRAKIICWWIRCRMWKKREALRLTTRSVTWATGRMELPFPESTAWGWQARQVTWKPQRATKFPSAREEFKFKLSDAKIRAVSLLSCCVH